MVRLFCRAILLSVGMFELAVLVTLIPKKVAVGGFPPVFKSRNCHGKDD